ncbi:UDP-N-acetylglucosamine 1-carboxyvinyltransferase [Patescibacteria group bacterium]|nr:UDP-N-acetylglucosamine 1-carboxyvinyltransferase [Patescibacteria group bacterium]MBU1448974.1 UDP-N-acetylglucosamine 1-carboxyvinyltransferase [Patescibacteria group bacterium]MBU2612914.1 UDP-N-acetylglucosamine 1-carboxyvinyltransferase [Patescibacteria group bacterium]
MTTEPNGSTRAYAITGGVPLRGDIRISGAKNAATKEIVAALLSDEPVTLHNVPDIGDVHVTLEMLKGLGAAVTFSDGTVTVDASGVSTPEVAEALSRKNRIPILLMGPLIHRFGEARIPALGGCTIGARPVDFHLAALKAMGAVITCDEQTYTASAKRLKGAVITLTYPSVGATENAMLAAVKAEGTTLIQNAAMEPEILDLAKLLQAMGAIINLDVNRTWVIEGVPILHGAVHRIIPDRIEAASFMVAAAITGGDVFVRDARQDDLLSFLNALRRVGVPFRIEEDGIRVSKSERIFPIALETDVHPGFMTDWQQPFVMLLTQAEGVSIVHETVFEDRFGYTEALTRMQANIQLHRECLGSKACRFVNRDYRHSAVIVGPTLLKAADIRIPDLRAGFSYLIAALIADGTSRLTNVELIERGYEDIIGKLKKLGAQIEVEG